MTKRLALDHMTTVDTTPVQLAEVAAQTGCAAMCLFMQPMDVLPLMPKFDIYGDMAQRAELKAAMQANGVALDVAYPFTLAGRTQVADFATAMECAAELGAAHPGGAGVLNALVYDRDPVRRVDTFGQFCDMARGFGLKVGLEFYPPSQVPSLSAALELVAAIGRPSEVGVNADLLHLMRSGGTIAELAAAPVGTVLYGQLADAPAAMPDSIDEEASSARQLLGAGEFDVAGFVAALPEGCPISIEIPRNAAVPLESTFERADKAVKSARAIIG